MSETVEPHLDEARRAVGRRAWRAGLRVVGGRGCRRRPPAGCAGIARPGRLGGRAVRRGRASQGACLRRLQRGRGPTGGGPDGPRPRLGPASARSHPGRSGWLATAGRTARRAARVRRTRSVRLDPRSGAAVVRGRHRRLDGADRPHRRHRAPTGRSRRRDARGEHDRQGPDPDRSGPGGDGSAGHRHDGGDQWSTCSAHRADRLLPYVVQLRGGPGPRPRALMVGSGRELLRARRNRSGHR